jgi:hypothetical protein
MVKSKGRVFTNGMSILRTDTLVQGNVCKIQQGKFLIYENKAEKILTSVV